MRGGGVRVKRLTRFRLPYMGKDLFKALMRAGLKYDRKGGGFYIDGDTDTTRLAKILREKLDLELEILKDCAICGSEIDCEACGFNEHCLRGGDTCICLECYGREDAFGEYVKAQEALLFASK